ncbi:MAG: hypothetical protein WC942_11335, partial [Clostridia bacterium]
MASNKLIELFNKKIKNEIDVSNYLISKQSSVLQNTTFNTPSLSINIGKGTTTYTGDAVDGYFGDYTVEDRGSEYLVTIEAGVYNGVYWETKDIVIPKTTPIGSSVSGIYYVYVDAKINELQLAEVTETTSPETTNFVLMVVLVPDNPEGFVKEYTTEENITSFIYGYQAN